MCFLSGRKAEQLFGHREVKREVMDMERNEAIAGLVAYGLKNGLIEEEDRIWAALKGRVVRFTSSRLTSGYSGIRTNEGNGESVHNDNVLYLFIAIRSKNSVQKLGSHIFSIL